MLCTHDQYDGAIWLEVSLRQFLFNLRTHQHTIPT